MPCALTLDAKYPEYVKKILKEIEAGNDQGLKACACALKPVVDEEGCTVTYTDNEGNTNLNAIFPFCIEDTETDPKEIEWQEGLQGYKLYQVGFELKDLMEFFWNFKEWSGVTGRSTGGCPKTTSSLCSSNVALQGVAKERVCLGEGGAYGDVHILRTNTYLEDYAKIQPCSLTGFTFFGLTDSTSVNCYRYNNLYYPSMVIGIFGAGSNPDPFGDGGAGISQVYTFKFKISKGDSASEYSAPIYNFTNSDCPVYFTATPGSIVTFYN